MRQTYIFLIVVFLGIFILAGWQFLVYKQPPISCGGDFSYDVECPVGTYCKSLGQGPLAGGLCQPYAAPVFRFLKIVPEPAPQKDERSPELDGTNASEYEPAPDQSDWSAYRDNDWSVHRNDKIGFQVILPDNWDLADETHLTMDRFAFGNPDNFSLAGYDGEFFIFIFQKDLPLGMFNNQKPTPEIIIQSMGDQFADRKVTRSSITIHGVPADRVTVTTPSYPSWILEAVIFERDDTIYWIHNGAQENNAFEPFYRSFEFI